MIECVDRQTVFSKYRFLASLVRESQDARSYVDENATDEERHKLEQWRTRACDRLPIQQHVWCENLLLEQRCPRIKDFPRALSDSLSKLFGALNLPTVCFVPGLRTPWLSNPDTYPPVRAAQSQVRSLLPTEPFDGGLVVDLASLSEIVPFVFWTARCCGSFPEIYVGAPDYPSVFWICKYGVLHAEVYDDRTASPLKRHASEVGLMEVACCTDRFSESCAIEGRTIQLD